MPQRYSAQEITPTVEDFEKLLTAKLSFEKAKAEKTPTELEAWGKGEHFKLTPWGIGYSLSKFSHEKSVARAKSKNWQVPSPKTDKALRYFIVAVMIDWPDLIDNLKRTLINWGYTSEDLQFYATDVWKTHAVMQEMTNNLASAQNSNKIKLIEAIEKHETLNRKLFTKDDILKEKVRDKMLEIVDEFVENLKEQNIKIKVEDVLFLGSNASYNYTKDSDIDLHILANVKAVEYPIDLGAALYSAYRSLFNKSLDIEIYGTDIEIFVETEDSERVSNGIYSVKKDKWVKKPVQEDIPEYDKEALDKLVSKWEDRCKKVLEDAKADKLKDEQKVLKLIEDIYVQLRKKGIAKSEYAIENLAFKELRNKGYLDELKEYKNILISKRLSLTERMNNQMRINARNQITQIAGSQPIVQDNGMFFLYNLKASDVKAIERRLRELPFILEVYSSESGKYDFSRMAMNQMPSKYYNIRGRLADSF